MDYVNGYAANDPGKLTAELRARVVGQDEAIEKLVPSVLLFQSDLYMPNRPIGNFLLIGPTGSGKTKMVEALAEVLHGSEKNIVKVDCGEFQLEHEVAKLIGAPPGYLGHRETQPALTQQRLHNATSERCGLSLVLFDEIEKAAPSVTQLLLGIMDKATLRLGDNSAVSFERSIIFMTSNLGAERMADLVDPERGMGFTVCTGNGSALAKALEQIGLQAVKRKFSPEFVNRFDRILTFMPLGPETLRQILDNEIQKLQEFVDARTAFRAFRLNLDQPARDFLLERGTSREYGARELKRTISKYLTRPLAVMLINDQILPGAVVQVAEDGEELVFQVDGGRELEPVRFLLTDHNSEFCVFLAKLFEDFGFEVTVAGSPVEAFEELRRSPPDAMYAGYSLTDGSVRRLLEEVWRRRPNIPVVIGTTATEADLPGYWRELRAKQNNLLLLHKPFSATDICNFFRKRLLEKAESQESAGGAAG